MMGSSFSKYKRPEKSVRAIIYRLVVGPFYKQHAGTFLFLYVLFLGSFLFINYLGKMPASESFFWHFILMIFMVTHQFMVVLFIILAGFYLIKTRYFVKRILEQESCIFLKQSLAVVKNRKLWWLWLQVEIRMSLPLILYGLACLGMAIYMGIVLYGIVIMFFLTMCIIAITSMHCRQLIKLRQDRPDSPFKIKGISRWNRTAWTMIIAGATRLLPAVLITKAASVFFTLLMVHWSGEEMMNARQWWLCFLLTGTIHALIVFKIAQFMEEWGRSLLGLPLKEFPAFLFFTGRTYLLLLLPECLILLFSGYFQLALLGTISELCILLFYHYFSYYLQFNLKFLLKSGFIILCLAFVLTLFGLFWLTVLFYLVASYFIFRERYYCKE